MESKYITLSQLQLLIGNTIRMNRQLQGVWVMAELSDVRVAGGHCYMELIEKDQAGATRAKSRAMIWSSTFMMLRRKFLQATGRDIQSGMKVLVQGTVNYHNVYGLSFVISDIDPTFTLGDMERLRREILERLHREGLDDYNRSLEMPLTPQKIAVISAAGAAGYGDFINQVESNPEGFRIYPMLFPAVMQGERTAPSVMAALDLIESTLDFWDCVVIIRGGGATTDLNGFDNYDLARRVATFPLPVVVGIGHERDRTVLDELACVRCKTPTAVAAYIVDALRNAFGMVVQDVRAIAKYSLDALKGEHLRLANLSQTIPARAQGRVMREKMRLQNAASGLERAVAGRFGNEQVRLERLALRVDNSARNALQRARQQQQRLADMIRLLSPQNTLRRGYSITRFNGHTVTDATQIPPGSEIETTLLNGTVKSKTI